LGSVSEQNLEFKKMSNKKILLFLKIGVAGVIIAWVIFLSSNVGFPKSPHPIIFSLGLTASSFVSTMILVSPFLYTKKERKIDKLLGEKSSVDDATFNLLHAIDHEINPEDDFKPKHTVELSEQILLLEIEKAKEAGADNQMIADYLQRELKEWIENSTQVESDFETYKQVIMDLRE
jgi:hypothetical protein